MSSNTIVARTVLGDALRRLGDLVDGAPSILSAKRFESNSVDVNVVMTTPAAVEVVASDLGIPTKVAGEFTIAELKVGPVSLCLIADGTPRELHRPVDVTETIEERS